MPAVGKYYIQARWPADATRSTSASYTAVGSDGTTTRSFNQQVNNNAWVNIGVKINHAVNNVLTVNLATSSTGTVAADMVRAVPYQITGTNIHYVFTDHLNTPRVITRATDNQMVWRWDNTDPFGVIQPNENPNGFSVFKYNPRFPGQVYDSETGLNYNYHRSYDSAIGSYTTSDPIGLAGGWNTYAYVGGNPVNEADPTGEIYGYVLRLVTVCAKKREICVAAASLACKQVWKWVKKGTKKADDAVKEKPDIKKPYERPSIWSHNSSTARFCSR